MSRREFLREERGTRLDEKCVFVKGMVGIVTVRNNQGVALGMFFVRVHLFLDAVGDQCETETEI